MGSNEELFDQDSISSINEFVENKSNLLNEIKDFKEKDKTLSLYMDELEKQLDKESKDKFDQIIKLMYQVEEYYIALAYSLGTKYGENIENL